MVDLNYQIKPLDSSNYSTSSMDVQFLLHEKNCFEIVAGKESSPEIKEENRLPSEFDSIVQNILHWTDETFKYKDILLELVAEETRIDSRDDLSLQRSQHEMFSVQKSKVLNPQLRPFASILYVETPRPLREKLDPKAKKGILVGFAQGTRYRVWIPEDSRVIENANVRL
ncbi:hypothetical protein TNCV_1565381 [Trichonephila clavipes]|nr:hypothetical protein TNCV_1565381 [Trichonephila clavipes]